MRRLRLLLVLVAILVVGLLAQAVFDSAVGAWAAVGALTGIVACKVLGWIGLWPADWPDVSDGGGE